MQRLSLPITGICSFGEYPIRTDLEQLDADIAALDTPADFVVGYVSGACLGPRRIRETSTQYNRGETDYYGFEHDCQRLAIPLEIVDCGDADILQADPQHTFDAISDGVRGILRRGAMPIIFGDDHSTSAPVDNALEELGEKTCVVQFDAHLDRNDHVDPLRYGNDSPMHRLSEVDHIDPMIQIGLHGIGSSKKTDFDDAKKYGSVLISSREADQMGMKGVSARVPKAKNYYVTVGIDGFDVPIIPGVASPYPGGLLFDQMCDIISGAAKMGCIVAADSVKIAPSFDPPRITVRLGALIVLHTMDQIEAQVKEQRRNSWSDPVILRTPPFYHYHKITQRKQTARRSARLPISVSG